MVRDAGARRCSRPHRVRLSNETIAAGSGFTARVSLVTRGTNITLSEDLVQATPGATTGTFTYGQTGYALSHAVAFKPAP